MAQSRAEEVAREDLMTFINAAFTCTGQREFYGDTRGQRVSIAFLHEYVRGNYRRLYARTLATGINHYNQAEIIRGLLAAGCPADPAQRAEENALVTAALARLPPQRALGLMDALRRARVNNRRTRAVMERWLAARRDPVFDAVKYRGKVRALAVHAHLSFGDERDHFLFRGWRQRRYETALFETFRQAHFSEEALYDLPFTVADGLARARRVPRDRFLERIAPRMTAAERLRAQETASREGVELAFDLGRAPLTKLAIYLLSLPLDERKARREELSRALDAAAARTFARAPFRLGRVALVLDRSHSSSGSSEKRRRPLGVALGCLALLRHAAASLTVHPTAPLDDPADPILITPHGQTALAGPCLDALATAPDLVLIVSDGCENDPPDVTDALVRLYHERIDRDRRTQVIHLNPVWSEDDYAPRALGSHVPTLGLRDAEDLPTVLGFARFAAGSATLAELEDYLAHRVRELVGDGGTEAA